MSTYQLTYFPCEAKGELIRFILAQTNTDYKDVRISNDEWEALKPTTPFGCIPILEVDGDTLAGSGPIARYLAEKLDLAGSNDIENAKIAGIKDIQNDIVKKLLPAFFEEDETKKQAMKKEVIENIIPKYLGIMEKTIKDNHADEGWLFGPKLTYVDLNLYLVVDFMKLFKEDGLFNWYPGIEKLMKNVSALPNIAEWLKKRPETKGPPVA